MAKLAKYFILSLSCGTKVAKFEADRAVLNTNSKIYICQESDQALTAKNRT